MEFSSSIGTYVLFTFLPTLLCMGAVFKMVSIKNKNSVLVNKLSDASIILERKDGELAALKKRYSTVLKFQNSLQVAELSTQLQAPRTSAQTTPKKSFAPEKYKYAQSLAEKGMSAEEIGSILTMSSHETNQLISLSRIAQSHC